MNIKMRTVFTTSLCVAVCVGLFACSKEADKVEQDHVFKGQVKAYEKAQQVEGVVLDSVEQQHQQIDKATQ